MATVNDNRVRKRVGAILFINRLQPYSGAVGTGGNVNARYPDDQEITDAMLQADALICQARASTIGDPYRRTWMKPSAPLAHGDPIPAHIGVIGDVEVWTGSDWRAARYASNRADIMEMRVAPALYPNCKEFVFLDLANSRILIVADQARITYPDFEIGDGCQAPDVDEAAVVFGTVGLLGKDGAATPEVHQAGMGYLTAYIAMLKGEPAVIPDVARYETQ